MNLFRSGEHVRRWSGFDPSSDEAIMPLADWATLFSGLGFRRRLDDDYLAHRSQYSKGWGEALEEIGKSGAFWER